MDLHRGRPEVLRRIHNIGPGWPVAATGQVGPRVGAHRARHLPPIHVPVVNMTPAESPGPGDFR